MRELFIQICKKLNMSEQRFDGEAIYDVKQTACWSSGNAYLLPEMVVFLRNSSSCFKR
jgi:hypothetical protein